MSKLTFSEISQQTIDQLITYERSQKVERRLHVRVGIILYWMRGLTYQASSEKQGVSETVIGKWRKRFADARIEGLSDAPHPGRPVLFCEANHNKVIHLACQCTENGTQRYSQHEIAEQCGRSLNWVSEMLR